MVATLASCVVKPFYGVIRGTMEHVLTVAPALALREGDRKRLRVRHPGRPGDRGRTARPCRCGATPALRLITGRAPTAVRNG